MRTKIKNSLIRGLVAVGFYALVTNFAELVSADGMGISLEWRVLATIIFLLSIETELG